MRRCIVIVMWSWAERAMARSPPTNSACHPLQESFGYRLIYGSNKSLVTRLCHNTDGGATGVRCGRRPQIRFLPLVKHTSKVLDVLRTLARDPERSKYRTAACRPDAKWSAAAGRPTSPHLNRDSCALFRRLQRPFASSSLHAVVQSINYTHPFVLTLFIFKAPNYVLARTLTERVV